MPRREPLRKYYFGQLEPGMYRFYYSEEAIERIYEDRVIPGTNYAERFLTDRSDRLNGMWHAKRITRVVSFGELGHEIDIPRVDDPDEIHRLQRNYNIVSGSYRPRRRAMYEPREETPLADPIAQNPEITEDMNSISKRLFKKQIVDG